MKKILEKRGALGCTGWAMTIIAFILFIVAAFVDSTTPDMVLKVIGILLFIFGGLMVALTSDDHHLIKSILVFVLAGIILTWLVPYGYFQGTEFYESEMARIGLFDVGFMLYHAVNFSMDKIVFLFLVGGFYGVISKTNGYQNLIEKLSKKLKNHAIIVSVIISIILYVLTSMLSQTFIVILFIPFFISLLYKMNLDKLTTFAVTFGSALIGVLGCTYGTDSLSAFNYYISQELTLGLNYRFIIAAVALVLYEFFIVMRVRKVLSETKKNTKNNELTSDPFVVEKPKEKKSCVPTVIVLLLLAVITILGYIAWNDNFGIEIFDNFHAWLIGLEATDDFTIISYILGANAKAFGGFLYVFSISIVVILASMLISFIDKGTVNEYITNFYEGVKKMVKPILVMEAVYLVFSVCYLSPVVPYLANWIANLVNGFNPFITTIIAFVASVFQTDFGFTAYTVGGLITGVFAENLELVHVIFTAMYGLVGIFVPTSALLVVGLSFMKLDYKDWLKYIWLFVAGMLVILLVLFAVVAYV